MSIANELSRLLQAKSDLATSITNKGVTVPAATTLDGYAALVDQIQQGGGSGLLLQGVEIEYLEGTGTQYIDLDFGFDKTDEIQTDFAVMTTGADKYINSPITWNNNNNRFGMGYYSGYCVAYGNSGTGGTRLVPTTNNDFKIHHWEYKNYVFSVTDLGLTKNVSSITFGGTTAKLRLFYGYNSVTQAKISYYKHIKNGVSVIELIPIRIGQIGYMYDKVTGSLYGNKGSGNFTLGPDVT